MFSYISIYTLQVTPGQANINRRDMINNISYGPQGHAAF
jgi:hypothetical protein